LENNWQTWQKYTWRIANTTGRMTTLTLNLSSSIIFILYRRANVSKDEDAMANTYPTILYGLALDVANIG
jgi:hypothetical protein